MGLYMDNINKYEFYDIDQNDGFFGNRDFNKLSDGLEVNERKGKNGNTLKEYRNKGEKVILCEKVSKDNYKTITYFDRDKAGSIINRQDDTINPNGELVKVIRHTGLGRGEDAITNKVTLEFDSNGNQTISTTETYQGKNELLSSTSLYHKYNSNGVIIESINTIYDGTSTTRSEGSYTYRNNVTKISENIFINNIYFGERITEERAAQKEIKTFDINGFLVEKYTEKTTDDNGKRIEKVVFNSDPNGNRKIVIERFVQVVNSKGKVISESKEKHSPDKKIIDYSFKEFDSFGNLIVNKYSSLDTGSVLTVEEMTFNKNNLLTKEVKKVYGKDIHAIKRFGQDICDEYTELRSTTTVTPEYDKAGKLVHKYEFEEIMISRGRVGSSTLKKSDGDGRLISKVETEQNYNEYDEVYSVNIERFNSNEELVMKTNTAKYFDDNGNITDIFKEEEKYDNNNLISKVTTECDSDMNVVYKTEVVQGFDSDGKFMNGKIIKTDFTGKKPETTIVSLNKDITIIDENEGFNSSVLRDTDKLVGAMNSFPSKESIPAPVDTINSHSPILGPRSLVPVMNYASQL